MMITKGIKMPLFQDYRQNRLSTLVLTIVDDIIFDFFDVLLQPVPRFGNDAVAGYGKDGGKAAHLCVRFLYKRTYEFRHRCFLP